MFESENLKVTENKGRDVFTVFACVEKTGKNLLSIQENSFLLLLIF